MSVPTEVGQYTGGPGAAIPSRTAPPLLAMTDVTATDREQPTDLRWSLTVDFAVPGQAGRRTAR
ncbi:MAG: hypothetical protein OEV40_29165 [Acidimicrobiia bacterium]|nr:hypothetical protein [Acidimicrobiia bacterium]